LAEAQPIGLESWLAQAIGNPAYGKAREMLALAVARHVPREEAIPILLDVLEDLPGHVAMALGKIGDVRVLEALESQRAVTSGWTRKEIDKAMRSIERRRSG
jgi:hypothetical protein